METVNLAEKFGQFSDAWSPKIVGDVNDMHVKVVKGTLNTGNVINERTVADLDRLSRETS